MSWRRILRSETVVFIALLKGLVVGKERRWRGERSFYEGFRNKLCGCDSLNGPEVRSSGHHGKNLIIPTSSRDEVRANSPWNDPL